jgi:hypothetical protein
MHNTRAGTIRAQATVHAIRNSELVKERKGAITDPFRLLGDQLSGCLQFSEVCFRLQHSLSIGRWWSECRGKQSDQSETERDGEREA